ncbi:MAG: DNA mismatch repair protein MutS [Bdellovibrionaceae bacterium]|nr:DNA mismatch repair protein MutS [Pseudobdellovibrionaceae bacterium]
MTPLMKQYWDIKSQHKDKILLFRMGDFFELFHEDAKVAAPLLNIRLTYRNKKSTEKTPMCGFPHHSLKLPIATLLSQGYKVAICDQVEEASEAKILVKREVTHILSPGMVYDPDTLDALSQYFIAAYDESSVAFLDLSTGEAFYYIINTEEEALALLHLLKPVELVVTAQQRAYWLNKNKNFHLSVHSKKPEEVIKNTKNPPIIYEASAVNFLLSYIHTVKPNITHTQAFKKRSLKNSFTISDQSLYNLEVFKNYEGQNKGSLFSVINKTRTAGGARLLKDYLKFPLTDKAKIISRQNKIKYWVQQTLELKAVRQHLSLVGDIQRSLLKLSYPSCHPRDILFLSKSLKAAAEVYDLLSDEDKKYLPQEIIIAAFKISEQVDNTLVADPPSALKNGGFIKPYANAQLDELRSSSQEGDSYLQNLAETERERTGISSLKISYSPVFGFYIEVTNTHKDKVPLEYKAKQSLKQATRYGYAPLDKVADKLLLAKQKTLSLEYECLNDLKKEVSQYFSDFLLLSRFINETDVLSSLSWLALENNYICPEFTENHLSLLASRHPVLEQLQNFTANDIHLKQGCGIVLTGPNMAGKSTIMRQVALSVLLCQIGSFVPARQAQLCLFDGIYTRIGASDILSEGVSTFMLEMQETASILKTASTQSLVVLDEIGRGTSTYDGLSLAQAILEYFLSKTKATLLFSTHYHEIASLESRYSNMENQHMAVKENTQKDNSIEFLYTLTKGSANKSYGLYVAKLAGLPTDLLNRAKDILHQLEA